MWLPIWIGLACMSFATMITRFVPETLPETAAMAEVSTEETPHITQAIVNKPSRLFYIAQSEMAKLGQSLSWLAKRHYHVMALLFTLLLTTFGRFAQELLSQYVTKRYSWSWSQVSALSLFKSKDSPWDESASNISTFSQAFFYPFVPFSTLSCLVLGSPSQVIYLFTSCHSQPEPRISG